MTQKLIVIDKLKGYIGEKKDEFEFNLRIFANSTKEYLQKNLTWTNVGRTASVVTLLYSLAVTGRSCTTLPSSFIAVPEGQPAATEVMENSEGDTQGYEAIPTETSIPTKESTPTISPEQIEREEILERLKTRDFGWTFEEINSVIPEWGDSEENFNYAKEESLSSSSFIYYVFSENETYGFGQRYPYNSDVEPSFAEKRGAPSRDVPAEDDEVFSNFLTSITAQYIEEGWDYEDHDTIIFITTDENGNSCYWPKDAKGVGWIFKEDKSVDMINFNNPSDTKTLTNAELKLFDQGFSTLNYLDKTEDRSPAPLCNYENDLASGFEGHSTPTPEVTPTTE